MKKQVKAIMIVLMLFCVASYCKAEGYSKHYQHLPFDIPEVITPVIPGLKVSLVEYGGIGDGITLNTQAFSAAIADLSNRGGGHLIVPEGVWLTGPIVLKSNIDLHVVKNAIVLFTPDKTQYPILPPDEGTSGSRCQSPVSAYHQSNFSITGEGVFDGNGEVWRPVKRFKVSDAEWNSLIKSGGVVQQDGAIWYPWSISDEEKRKENLVSLQKRAKKRPRMLRFVGCETVLLQGVVFQNSPSFHVNLILSNNLVVDGITVRCPWNAQNGDGIDLSSCTNALIVNCSVDAGDDAICLKSGIGDVGRKRGPCANIVVDSCTVFHGHGGFVIGSDTGGGMNNVFVKNCRFIDTDTGLRFKSKRGRGGCVSNVYVDNIVMNDIANDAILFDMYYQEKSLEPDEMPVDKDTPHFQDIHISNIICRDAGRAMLFNGLPEMNVKNVSLTNCTIHAIAGAQINETCELQMENIQLDVTKGPVLSFNNSKDIRINNLNCAGSEEQTVRVSGSANRDIRIKGGNLSSKNVISTPEAEKTIIID